VFLALTWTAARTPNPITGATIPHIAVQHTAALPHADVGDLFLLPHQHMGNLARF
jgi:hypothetical protein